MEYFISFRPFVHCWIYWLSICSSSEVTMPSNLDLNLQSQISSTGLTTDDPYLLKETANLWSIITYNESRKSIKSNQWINYMYSAYPNRRHLVWQILCSLPRFCDLFLPLWQIWLGISILPTIILAYRKWAPCSLMVNKVSILTQDKVNDNTQDIYEHAK